MVASTLQAALRDFLDRRALAWPNGKADATRATSRSGYVAQMAKLRMVGGDFTLAAAMAWRILAKAVGHINDAKCLELGRGLPLVRGRLDGSFPPIAPLTRHSITRPTPATISEQLAKT